MSWIWLITLKRQKYVKEGGFHWLKANSIPEANTANDDTIWFTVYIIRSRFITQLFVITKYLDSPCAFQKLNLTVFASEFNYCLLEWKVSIAKMITCLIHRKAFSGALRSETSDSTQIVSYCSHWRQITHTMSAKPQLMPSMITLFRLTCLE